MARFPVVRVLGESPRPNSVVFNAPRPLPGCESWTGPFVCGEHYSIVDLSMPETGRVLADVAALRGVVLRYVTEDECIERVVQHAAARGVGPERLVQSGVVETALKLWRRDDESIEIGEEE